MYQDQYILRGLLVDIFKKDIPAEPTYTINGYPAFLNYYLMSPYMDWEDFCVRVLLHQLDMDRAETMDYSYLEGIGDIECWALAINTKKNIEYFNILMSTGVIGCIGW